MPRVPTHRASRDYGVRRTNRRPPDDGLSRLSRALGLSRGVAEQVARGLWTGSIDRPMRHLGTAAGAVGREIVAEARGKHRPRGLCFRPILPPFHRARARCAFSQPVLRWMPWLAQRSQWPEYCEAEDQGGNRVRLIVHLVIGKPTSCPET
jgi:hypothetical protein